MVYRNKLVAVVKVNGKVLRETDGTVTLPFGSEYSILVKNMNSVRAQVKISIDGTDATEDAWLVLQPNSELELERFIRAGNLARGNRFKFIERTGEIEEHRGIKAEDGLVRVEYKFEKLKPIVRRIETHNDIFNHPYGTYPWPPRYPYVSWNTGLIRGAATRKSSPRPLRTRGISGQSCGDWQASETQFSCNNSASGEMERSAVVQDYNDAGITVAGSESHQAFQSVSGFETEQSEVLVLKLRGSISRENVKRAVMVDDKPVCGTCGRRGKSNATFCSKCGTALRLI